MSIKLRPVSIRRIRYTKLRHESLNKLNEISSHVNLLAKKFNLICNNFPFQKFTLQNETELIRSNTLIFLHGRRETREISIRRFPASSLISTRTSTKIEHHWEGGIFIRQKWRTATMYRIHWWLPPITRVQCLTSLNRGWATKTRSKEITPVDLDPGGRFCRYDKLDRCAQSAGAWSTHDAPF